MSLGDLVRTVREAKAQAPHDPAVDAALRQMAAATGNPFWQDVADRILLELGASPVPAIPGPSPTTPAPTPAPAPEPGPAEPEQPRRSWSELAKVFLREWVWKYVSGRLSVALLSAAAAVGVWRAASGPPAKPEDARPVPRTEVLNRLSKIEADLVEAAGGQPNVPVARAREILQANRSELQ